MAGALMLWLGIGTGWVMVDWLDHGRPDSVLEWLNYVLCPLLWPIALYRRLS